VQRNAAKHHLYSETGYLYFYTKLAGREILNSYKQTLMQINPSRSSILFLAVIMTAGFSARSQDCKVEADSLKGTYTGGCKKGSASGTGKAVGIHIYEGEFKNGLPHGTGAYTWPGGSNYTGAFVKGLREGKGLMITKIPGAADSTTEGYWKKDKYIGKYEAPWKIISRTGSITTTDVSFSADEQVRQVKIIVLNTTAGAKTISGYEMPKYTVDNINIIKGAYVDVMKFDGKTKGTQTTLIMVQFPLQVVLRMGREELNVEFSEAGNYTLTVHINE
jgi:hypothetical protein